jgi:lipopolysaccharide biosynthesis regulator YciM
MLAVVHFNGAKEDLKSDQARIDVAKGMELLMSAQRLDKKNPVVSVFLADILFKKSEYQKSLALAQQALANTDNKDIQALANYFAGRVHHVQVSRKPF